MKDLNQKYDPNQVLALFSRGDGYINVHSLYFLQHGVVPCIMLYTNIDPTHAINIIKSTYLNKIVNMFFKEQTNPYEKTLSRYDYLFQIVNGMLLNVDSFGTVKICFGQHQEDEVKTFGKLLLPRT